MSEEITPVSSTKEGNNTAVIMDVAMLCVSNITSCYISNQEGSPIHHGSGS
jgi:hypothetical protein